MTRFTKTHRVFVIEEPVPDEGYGRWDIKASPEGVTVCVPRIPAGLDDASTTRIMQRLVRELAASNDAIDCVAWFYTPMMFEWSDRLTPSAVVYDCMDELSKFKFAPTRLMDLERDLFKRADLVFTGGHSLYEAKKKQHHSVHEFPSSIDAEHFRTALKHRRDPQDQRSFSKPRIGYAGVIDERLDLELLDIVAALRPQWQFMMIGPVVKIDPESLPKRDNIHYLGQKNYADLPSYFAGWDIGMMPFALNESTEFISPTKTPEYLSAGLGVVSTPIKDVITPYGDAGIVKIAADAEQFVQAIEHALAEDRSERLKSVEQMLAGRSWDRTFNQMNGLISAVRPKAKTATMAASAGRSSEIPFVLG